MPKCEKLPSGSWRIRIRTKTEDKSFTAPTKAECELLYAKYKAGIRTQSVNKTVRQAIEEYIELSKPILKETTISGYKTVLKCAFPTIIDTSIDELDDITVQKAINRECKRVNERNGKVITPKTVNNEWGLISTALRTITHKNYSVRLPDIPTKVINLPDPLTILEAFRGTEIELPVLLAIWCGLRASEIYGLTYESIDGDYLIIDKTRVTVDGERILRHTAKTDTSIRRVKLPQYIKDIIPQNDDKNAFLINLTHQQVYQRYRTILRHLGVSMTFHQLRHEFASISLTILQLPEKEVQMAGGWKTNYTMKLIYSNMFDSVRQEADNKRDSYFTDIIGSLPQKSHENKSES